ncbi:MAG: YihA family ribosome biogenesis GTP-binding protein [Sporocytophaga sp.]|uniref:ribosome biogenesis GTP-binding protein YihA/YsxC n=1 Tax=Sporocytophaga sp. TaxID=2231183 RepID=UPI001B270F81|nr:ribosome biogenesis GTP-binding protein YihA/YsxC [Sporocytophaga sp.]MBO9699185.1 YihA family ribosome biogenesis GTP-binding protein [Sporocytophaga sp.]
MIIKKADFVQSKTNYKDCPEPDKCEFAFIGRSNVGKSSLINMLTGQKGLAKTSAKPGKTQLINHFIINEKWYLVDLPGYGWAKVSKESKAKWEKMVKDYLTLRENLFCVFVLIDNRLEPQAIDIEFINWLGEKGIPFSLIFTKYDKLSKTQANNNLVKFENEMSKTWQELPPIFVTSSETGFGKEEVLNYLDSLVKNFEEQKN